MTTEAQTELKSFMPFLESAGQGCISGNINEWPQLKPACKWAAEKITCLESENAELRAKLATVFENHTINSVVSP